MVQERGAKALNYSTGATLTTTLAGSSIKDMRDELSYSGDCHGVHLEPDRGYRQKLMPGYGDKPGPGLTHASL